MEDREEPPDEKSNAQGRYISAILCAIFPGDSPLIESLKLEEMKSEPCLKGEPVHKKRFNTFYCTTLQQAARYAGKYDSGLLALTLGESLSDFLSSQLFRDSLTRLYSAKYRDFQ